MTAPNVRERILPRLIEDELKESFLDYSMSVIVQRALPDVRDGMKPVHRILYAMHELGLVPGRPYKKSATVVGDVLGKWCESGEYANLGAQPSESAAYCCDCGSDIAVAEAGSARTRRAKVPNITQPQLTAPMITCSIA